MYRPSTSKMGMAIQSCRHHLIGAAVFSAFINILYIAPTLYMLQVYDRVIPNGSVQTLLFITAILIIALVVLSLLDKTRTRLLVRAGVQLDAVLAPALLDATLGRPDQPTARQALRDIDTLRQTLSGAGVLALFDAPWTPIYVAICFVVHPALGAVALAGGALLSLLAWRNERATRSASDTAQTAASLSYASQDALLSGAEAVRALGMRKALVLRQLQHREAMLELQTQVGFVNGRFLTATKFVRLVLQSLALGLGALLAIENLISAGAIFAASFLIARALAPIEQVISSWRNLNQSYQIYHCLERLLIETNRSTPKTALPSPKGELVVDKVSLLSENGDRLVLSDVSFGVKAGEVVAIVGPSGAGKSTLARVIAGALTPGSGVVRIDGVDVNDWDPEAIAQHLGYLPQDPSLFAGTIKENVSRFAGQIDDSDTNSIDAAAVAAVDRARARSVIQSLNGGFDHVLRPGGRGLSAGQSQRVALARAMYRNPALLILDEPNAHLDAEGDAALYAAIAHYKEAGHTIIMISHKPNIVPLVDKLLVMRSGKVEHFGARDAVLHHMASQRPRVVSTPSAA